MKRLSYLVFLAVVAAVGCTSNDSPVEPTTTLPLELDWDGTTQNVESPERRPLSPNGAASFFFNVPQSGSVAARIVSLEPDASVTVGFGIGLWDGVACQTIPGVWADRATVGSVVQGIVTQAGISSLCVRIYDSTGLLPQPTFFQIHITHVSSS
jgi:hypothetical protein